jgi:hypothetical protein
MLSVSFIGISTTVKWKGTVITIYNREQPQQISTPVPYPFLLKATHITKLAFH